MTCSPETTIETTLGRLIERGYRFVHPRDANGELVAVVGVRVHGTVVDVVRLDAEDDVTAMRMPSEEPDILQPKNVLWRRDGDLETVIADLLALGDEDFTEPAEPTQWAARPGLSRGCWVPSGSGRAKWLQATA
ncbi:hypothetical protein ACFS2C_24990 [Prauserella oleivorans]|uniref:Uncharacterized protein n=1 Tax=Prauserella oleivorans TaxID=1478153 RepID=A0ABW5WGD1_9PSEU